MNILNEANKIVNDRSEEKERQYGSFSEGMKRAASIASGMTGKEITADDMFCCMVALKFSRQSFNHKTDNLLDAVAYIGAWNNFIEEKGADPTDPPIPADFKEKLEDEVFPKKGPEVHEFEKLKKYVEYLADCLDKTITYSEYIATKLGETTQYSEYVAERVNEFWKLMEERIKVPLDLKHHDRFDAGPK